MVSRTNTSKTIRRRRGGQSDKERLTAEKAMTGEIGAHKRTTVAEINRMKKDWEQVPGTGTSPYNPPKWRKKKKTTKKVVDSNGKVDSRRTRGEAAADKIFNTQRAKKARGDRAREKVYSGHEPAQDPIPVDVQKLGDPEGLKAHKLQQHLKQQGVDPKKEEELRKWIKERSMDDPNFAAKAGGKVSKSKGGTIKKRKGGKVKTKKTYGGHHGSKYVAKLYD